MGYQPIIPLYLQTLQVPPSLLAFLSGAVFSVVGVATVMASPFLGRLELYTVLVLFSPVFWRR